MQAVIFCGIQAGGKSTFYRENFFNSHVRISLDLLKTRHREWSFVETSIATKTKFVVDNTNPTIADRRRYLEAAKSAGFEVVCYFFESSLPEVLHRNRTRIYTERIPETGILACYRKLQIPTIEEGFDILYRVTIPRPNVFSIEEMEAVETASGR